MARQIGVRIGQEQATELLREWIAIRSDHATGSEGWRVSLIIVFAKKLHLILTGGTLEQSCGKDSGVFTYIASGVSTTVVPSNFECCERGACETDDDRIEGLTLSDPDSDYSIIVYRSKGPVLFTQTQLSTLLN
jgi:hypothetical protein